MLNQKMFSRFLAGSGLQGQPSGDSCRKTILGTLRSSSAWVAALALFTATGPAGAVLVGWWQLNEGTGTYIYDSSGNNITGCLGTNASSVNYDPAWSSSGSPWGTVASPNDSLYFASGGTDKIATLTNTALNTASYLTVACDFKVTSTSAQQMLVSKHNGGATGSYYIDLSGGNFVFIVQNAAGTRGTISWAVPAGDANTWHEVICTYNGTTLKLYHDGVFVASGPFAQGAVQSTPTVPVMFGNYYASGAATGSTAYQLVGYLDNVAIFNAALSDGGVSVGQAALAGSDIYNYTNKGAGWFIGVPVFTNQPISQVVAVGGTATFSAGVSNGTPPITYQWQLNGANVASATTNQLTITNVQTTNGGSYTLVATDAIGHVVTSSTALLVVGTVGHTVVGLWQLNECSGTNFYDISGNGLTGYLTNNSGNGTMPLWSGTGSTLGAGGGCSLYFPASQNNNSAQVNDTPLLDVTNAVTLAVDFKADNFGSQGVLASKHDAGSVGSYMLMDQGSVFYFAIINAAGTRVNLGWPIPAGEAGSWHQLIGTYDGLTMRLYHDGVLVTNTPQSGAIQVVPYPFMIGDFAGDNTQWEYQGYIDNVALFSTALYDGGVAVGQPAASGSDVYNLFESGAVSFVPWPAFTNQPVSQAVALGGTATFSAGVSNGTPP
jgi:hypothetical protein